MQRSPQETRTLYTREAECAVVPTVWYIIQSVRSTHFFSLFTFHSSLPERAFVPFCFTKRWTMSSILRHNLLLFFYLYFCFNFNIKQKNILSDTLFWWSTGESTRLCLVHLLRKYRILCPFCFAKDGLWVRFSALICSDFRFCYENIITYKIKRVSFRILFFGDPPENRTPDTLIKSRIKSEHYQGLQRFVRTFLM